MIERMFELARKHTSLLILVALLLAPLAMLRAADPAAGAKLPPKEQFHVFLLVGQSNMAGRGRVEPGDRQPHPRVLMLNQPGQWVPAIDPLHFDKPSVAGVGLGKTFGIEIAEANPGITVGLVPCAMGGSAIDSWKPGEKSPFWDDALRRARVALESGQLKGILWHQGEADSTAKLAPEYEQKLHELIARFRKELNAPEVPFLAGQMGQFSPWSDAQKTVDAAQRRLPDKVAHTAFVSSDGLTHKGDRVHFDSKSYREFGRRYANAWKALCESKEKERKDSPRADK